MKETFETSLNGRRSLHDDRKAAFSHELLKPLVREASRGRVFSLTYRGGNVSEWMRLYISGGGSLDIEVTGMDEASIAIEALTKVASPLVTEQE